MTLICQTAKLKSDKHLLIEIIVIEITEECFCFVSPFLVFLQSSIIIKTLEKSL